MASDFSSETMSFLDEKNQVPMKVKSSGQLLIDLLSFPENNESKEVEAMSVVEELSATGQVPVKSACSQELSCVSSREPVCPQDQLQPLGMTQGSPDKTHESLISAEAPPVPDPTWTRPRKPSKLKNTHKKRFLTQVKQMEAPCKAQVAVAEFFRLLD